MTRTGNWRWTAVTAACGVTALAAPAGAMALTTHSATDDTQNANGQLVATAKCGAGEHVVSGGYKGSDSGGAVVSRAIHGDSWTVHLYPGLTDTLTTYAYCARSGRIATHANQATGVAPPPSTTVNASCASGETLVSGGYAFLATPPSTQDGAATYKDYAASAHNWKVTVAFEDVPADIKAFAYCQRDVDVKVRSKTSDPIPDEGVGSVKASCHEGETLLAGGYTTTPKPDWDNNAGPDLFYFASHRSGSRSWTASAHNYSSVAGSITAFAYCET
jgi:hypothetical protein